MLAARSDNLRNKTFMAASPCLLMAFAVRPGTGVIEQFAKLVHGRLEAGERRRRHVIVALGQILLDAGRTGLVEHAQVIERGTEALVARLLEPMLRAHVVERHADPFGV